MWQNLFQQITRNKRLNASDSCSDDDDEPDQCGCRESSPGQAICFDDRCINFASQTECIRCHSGCLNNHFRKEKYANLEVIETIGKGHGLFTAQDLAKGQFVREYVGELINFKELRSRMDALGSNGHLYGMQLKGKADTFLDASKMGSISRFINHSCEPNCTVDFWRVGNRLRVGIFTSKFIPSGTELTFDYKWEQSNRQPTKCMCGTPSCRGYIEVMSDVEKRLVNTKKGQWLERKEVPQTSSISATSQLTSESSTSTSSDGTVDDCIDPYWLVGKRIKVWWEGNQMYFEADVEDFYPDSEKHALFYLFDQSRATDSLYLSRKGKPDCEENSRRRGEAARCDWLWLDESKDEKTIKKKVFMFTISSTSLCISLVFLC